ncbi:MAG: hypothetical protein IPH28_23465 [Cytophagaceae bacterium]|nr:hypothetical protein [Cytophagaceae bacterium]
MKKLFTLGALLFAGTAFAQTENVGIGTVKPDKSAILDLSSTVRVSCYVCQKAKG